MDGHAGVAEGGGVLDHTKTLVVLEAMEPFPAGVALHAHHDKPILLQSREMPLASLAEAAKKASNRLSRRASMIPGSVHM